MAYVRFVDSIHCDPSLGILCRGVLQHVILLMLIAGSVAKHALINILNKGHSICLVVGGGSESLLSLPGTYELVLNRRKGFIKVALETGASLVPCVGFGETESYRTINQLPHDSFLRRWQRNVERTLGFTLPICIGVGLFLPYGILPFPVPMNVVVGDAIKVPKYQGTKHWEPRNGLEPLIRLMRTLTCVVIDAGDTDSAEFHDLVDKYHAIYKKALFKLFHDNKDKYAKSASDMTIIE